MDHGCLLQAGDSREGGGHARQGQCCHQIVSLLGAILRG